MTHAHRGRHAQEARDLHRNPQLQKARLALTQGRLEDAESGAKALLGSAQFRAAASEILAAVEEARGRPRAAFAILDQAIRSDPQHPGLHARLGGLLARAGRLTDAEVHLRFALQLDPQSEVTIALSELLEVQGRLAEAESLCRTAIESSPRDVARLMRLGRILSAQGRNAEAKDLFLRAATSGETLSSETVSGDRVGRDILHVEPLFALAEFAAAEGDTGSAAAFLNRAIETHPTPAIKLEIANLICAMEFRNHHPDLELLFARAIEEVWAVPADLISAGSRFLLLRNDFSELFRSVANPDSIPNALLRHGSAKAFASNKLLSTILSEGIVVHEQLEYSLTALRRTLLEAYLRSDSAFGDFFPFALALAHQCFNNEYAFAETAAESDAVGALEQVVRDALHTGAIPDELSVALFATYRALNRASWAVEADNSRWPEKVAPLVERQLREPEREAEIAQSLPRLTPIIDSVSIKVEDQYEQNPYPRWIKTFLSPTSYRLDEWLHRYFPYLRNVTWERPDPLQILVAGCGTGRDAIGATRRFRNANVVAIDLSLASLAYAMRKTTELGLGNISYGQADVLELGALGQKFDLIHCVGVLHHLDDPLRGWRSLCESTIPGGYMLIALYSEAGRADLVAARNFAVERGYSTSPQDLRRFRADVLALPGTHPARSIARSSEDFYSLSMLRDMLFHAKEHRFTITALARMIDQLGLQFCGFLTEPNVQIRFDNLFSGKGDSRSLEQWHAFEQRFPRAFSGMYHFVVRRP